jgi:hypothetical protein
MILVSFFCTRAPLGAVAEASVTCCCVLSKSGRAPTRRTGVELSCVSQAHARKLRALQMQASVQMGLSRGQRVSKSNAKWSCPRACPAPLLRRSSGYLSMNASRLSFGMDIWTRAVVETPPCRASNALGSSRPRHEPIRASSHPHRRHRSDRHRVADRARDRHCLASLARQGRVAFDRGPRLRPLRARRHATSLRGRTGRCVRLALGACLHPSPLGWRADPGVAEPER